MKRALKWVILIFLAFFAEQYFLIDGITLNFSFLLIYLFAIEHTFTETEQKKIASSELLPLLFFAMTGLIEDLFQGIIGPAIISKSISGMFLIVLTRQLFFHWTEIFKTLVIFSFTILDETIYSFIVIYFFSIEISSSLLLKKILISGLINIPFGLILSWKKP
ncbi:hypothetical protein [Thermodesulfovibrio hydrogeniphilus]